MLMNVHVVNRRHNTQVEDFVRERLELIVGRFHDRLSGIDVHLRDENAGKGGIDKSCSIDAHLVPRGSLHVQATEPTIYDAIRKAVHRLETVVAKTVDRGHRGRAIRHAGGGLRHENNRIGKPDE